MNQWIRGVRVQFKEPRAPRYIFVDQRTNVVNLLVPLVGGQEISTDNTCKVTIELEHFFNGGALNSLNAYKEALEFDLSLLDDGCTESTFKRSRLASINQYIELLSYTTSHRRDTMIRIRLMMEVPSNLYRIQLRPREQDVASRVTNPVFSINRGNTPNGEPLSPLYGAMHATFPHTSIAVHDPLTMLTTAVLAALPVVPTFEDIRDELTKNCTVMLGMDVDFCGYFKPINGALVKQMVDKQHLDALMGFSVEMPATPKDYIDALLGACTPSLKASLPIGTSSFYSIPVQASVDERTECLSILTQFFLATLNVHCYVKKKSHKNFGQVLDASVVLSCQLVDAVAAALSAAQDVEATICVFCDKHAAEFGLFSALSSDDVIAVKEKFERTYRAVTATKENPHMDDFMILDLDATGDKTLFVMHQGAICFHLFNILDTAWFDTFDKAFNVEWVVHSIAMPPNNAWIADGAELNVEQLFLQRVAEGKQAKAEALCIAVPECRQILLKTAGVFTDYSGRTFNCTAYEYAWWAKDTHMRCMLERYLDADTKAFLLEKVEAIERSGLAYQQHGKSYQNPHYDTSFVLNQLSPNEFVQLQNRVGTRVDKIRNATIDTYRELLFSATEFEDIKHLLSEQRSWISIPFFPISVEQILINKLHFDFYSLETALQDYVSQREQDFNEYSINQAWLRVGRAQREVPAHIAHEYCHPWRPLNLIPEDFCLIFSKTRRLVRTLTYRGAGGHDSTWFPLSRTGLGVEFALYRADNKEVICATQGARIHPHSAHCDLQAIIHLNAARTADLEESLEQLRQSVNPPRFMP